MPFLSALSLVFIAVFSVVTAKSLSDALLLSHCPIDDVPYIFVITGVALAVSSYLYFILYKKLKIFLPNIVSSGVIAASYIACAFILYGTELGPGGFFAISAWLIIAPSFLNILAWNIIADTFDTRQSRRLFAYIFAASTLGGLLSGLVTPWIIGLGGVEALIGLVAAFAILFFFIVFLHMGYARLSEASQVAVSGDGMSTASQGVMLFIRDLISIPLLKTLALIVFLGALVTNVIDFSFKMQLQAHFDKDAIGVFYGRYNVVANLVNITLQLFILPKLLRRFRIGSLYKLLPVCIFVGSLIYLIFPAFIVVVVLKFTDTSLRFTVQDSAREIAFSPLSAAVRNRAKVFIKGVVNPAGIIVSGLILTLPVDVILASDRILPVGVMVLTILWFAVVLRLNGRYAAVLLQNIHHSIAHFSDEERVMEPSKASSTTQLRVVDLVTGNDGDGLLKGLQDDSAMFRGMILDQILSVKENSQETEIPRMLLLDVYKRELKLAQALLMKIRSYDDASRMAPEKKTFKLLTGLVSNYVEAYFEAVKRILKILMLSDSSKKMAAIALTFQQGSGTGKSSALEYLQTVLPQEYEFFLLAVLLEAAQSMSDGSIYRIREKYMMGSEEVNDIFERESDTRFRRQ